MTTVAIRVVPFQASGAVGSQTITDPNGPGLTPKAALFVMAGATALDTHTDHFRLSVGMTDGTTQRCVAIMGEDGQLTATADTGFRIDTATVIQIPLTVSEGLEAEAAFSSFGNNQVTISWDVGVSYRGYVVLFYGEDLQANVTSFASSASIGGTASTTAPGFTPDFVIAAHVSNAFVADGSGNHAEFGMGFASRLSAIFQSCNAFVAEDRAVTATSTGTISRQDSMLTRLTSSGGTVTESTRLEMTSFDANGFTITTRNAAVALEAMYLSVRIGGSRCDASGDNIVAGTTGNKATVGVEFRPRAALFVASQNGALNTIASGTAQGQFSVGAAALTNAPGAYTQAVCSINWDDNETTANATCEVSNSNIIDVMDAPGTGHDWLASLVSFDPDGYTVNVSDAAGGNRVLAALAVGQLAGTDPPKGGRRWLRQLARM